MDVDALETNLVELERTDAVATVRLNRPDKLNALTPEMVDGLHDAFSVLADKHGTPVLLTGAGRVTCAGMDTEIVSGDYLAEYPDLNETLQEVYRLVETHPGPVGLAGKGAVVGAAALLSLSCDFTVLGSETSYVIPEAKYGISPTRAAELLPDLVGRHVAAELLLTGEEIDAERARAVGIANAVVPEAEVEAETLALLEPIADYDDETVATLVEALTPDPPAEQ